MSFSLDRYKDRWTYEYEMEVVTPMFLGGAEKENFNIRSASIKGMLRFWWRAIYGSEHGSITKMRNRENEIFGSTEHKSNVDIYVLHPGCLPKGDRLPNYSLQGGKTEVFRYLRFGASNDCKYIKPESRFKLRMRCNSSDYPEQIKFAFYCLCKFGGLGSKSRNGFGSVNYKEMNNNKLGKITNSMQEFTAFSKDALLFKDVEQESWEKSLGRIGQFYIEARKSIKPTEKRAYIGKPMPQKSIKDRYAKPYFLHVNKLENEKFQGQILFLPSDHGSENSEYQKVQNRVNEYFAGKMQEAIL